MEINFNRAICLISLLFFNIHYFFNTIRPNRCTCKGVHVGPHLHPRCYLPAGKRRVIKYTFSPSLIFFEKTFSVETKHDRCLPLSSVDVKDEQSCSFSPMFCIDVESNFTNNNPCILISTINHRCLSTKPRPDLYHQDWLSLW